ncbi:MAG: hypothetical protein ABH803_00750 [Candidatus Micrarchaeota archaeon]
MIEKTSLNELKHKAIKGEFASESPAKEYTNTPILMPVSNDSDPVMRVTTRQAYLDFELGNWRSLNIQRGLGVVVGIVALFLLSVNPLMAGATALVAGWFWGGYARTAFFLYKITKNRELLEGT